jgi:tetratricopeptide (TPR) repeat protein
MKPNHKSAHDNRKLARKMLHFDKAIELHPNNKSLFMNRGLAKFNLKDYKGAILDFDKVIQLKPNHQSAYDNRKLARKMLHNDKT